MNLCYEILIVVLSFFILCCYFSLSQLFTRKLCLQFSGLRMRSFTWNRFPIKNLLIDSLLTPIVESTYLNRRLYLEDYCSLSRKPYWQQIQVLKMCSVGTISVGFNFVLNLTLAQKCKNWRHWISSAKMFCVQHRDQLKSLHFCWASTCSSPRNEWGCDSGVFILQTWKKQFTRLSKVEDKNFLRTCIVCLIHVCLVYNIVMKISVSLQRSR